MYGAAGKVALVWYFKHDFKKSSGQDKIEYVILAESHHLIKADINIDMNTVVTQYNDFVCI